VGFLSGALGWESGLPTNGIAGVLTLFLPLAALLAFGAWRTRRPFALLLLLCLLQLAALALTQSRTGLVATGLGVLAGWVAARPPNWKWVAVGLALLAAIAIVVRLTPLLDWFVYAGANSWASVIAPRLGIWGQAIDGIRDHPMWGVGLGAFGSLARVVYPLVTPDAASPIEDAHNLYLQSALDLGLAGAATFLAVAAIVAVSAVQLVRTAPQGAWSRYWAAGLFGSLIAHALFGLTDAVALGTAAGAPLWFLFGLVMRATPVKKRAGWPAPALALFGGLVALLVVSSLALPVNRAGQIAARELLAPAADPAAAAARVASLAQGACRARWYEGLLRHAAGDVTGQSAAWGELLGCADDFTGYMAVLVPDDANLARRAIDARPESAAGYFWLAAMQATEAPEEAIALYRQGLALAPGDGRRWLALGELLLPRDESAALDAYLQACLNGDPGANGCGRAGSIAEARGDIQAAIEYYRLSNWSEALSRADELERLSENQH
jgi:tetratricopeptide (TPR) repeat protein